VFVVICDNGGQYNHWAIGPGINEILTGHAPRMPQPLVSDLLMDTLVKKGFDAALEAYKNLENDRFEGYVPGSAERGINAYGYAALHSGDVELAIEILKLNVALYPDSWNSYDSLGEAYLAAGNTELGEKNYATSRNLRDREGGIMEHLRAGRFDEARGMIETAHERDPKLQLLASEPIGPLFEQILLAGQIERALKLCQVWALADPGAAGPYFSMARAYKAQGKAREARGCYQRILEISPEGRAAEAARRALQGG